MSGLSFLSTPEMAQKYSIPIRTIQAACRAGIIPATRCGRIWLISPDAAQVFADQWKPRLDYRNGHG